MAFVSQSPRSIKQSNPTLSVGPGSYDIDGLAHKEIMNALYPKRNAPFNGSEARNL
jgi:hypothetical protein